jgi:galactonate dehydratase
MNRNVALRRMRLAAAAAPPPGEAAGGLFVSKVAVFRLKEPASGRSYSVVRVETRGGLKGYGECGAVTNADAAAAAGALFGRPATAYEWARKQLASNPAIEPGVTMALLDVTARYAKAPLYQLLGGPTRNKARAMARLEGESDDELLDAMKRARASGFRAFAVPVQTPSSPNSGQAFVHAVKARMEKLRSAAADADFVLDGSGSLTPGDAASLAAALERFHLLWFDEPASPSAHRGTLRKISQETVTPLGLGRGAHRAAEFQDLLREEVVDILRPSLARHGLAAVRKIAALAETYYVAVAPYHDGGPVATAAALHLAASLPNFFIQQIPRPASPEDRQMREELAGAAVESVKDGFAALPAGPGLGITVSDEALEKYKERA